MNENSILVKITNSMCLNCKKKFKPTEEIIFLKDTRMMHKQCYEKLREMVRKESDV